jgi:alkylhydroperoxidase family enzyme
MSSPKVSNLFVPYWAASKTALDLSVREQELIILRSAFLFQCDYVWGHHVPVIKEVGVGDEEIEKITKPIDSAGWSAKDAALLKMTDQIFSKANITENMWGEIKQHYSDAQLVDIIMVCSQYLLFNSVNNVFGLPLEHDGLPVCPGRNASF